MDNNLIQLLGVKFNKSVNKYESLILEVLIHIRIYYELKRLFNANDEESCEEKSNNIMEVVMFDGEIIRKLANDLIVSDDYTITGLAEYTGYPEDAIYELVSGINKNPTISLANKIIELHVTSRKELYASILRDLVKS